MRKIELIKDKELICFDLVISISYWQEMKIAVNEPSDSKVNGLIITDRNNFFPRQIQSRTNIRFARKFVQTSALFMFT